MCESVNLATIDALEQGLVTSTSIMVPCPGFEEFADYARTHPEKDFGIHLTLTCDADGFSWGPVLPKEDVASLVNERGTFWSTVEEVTQHAKVEEVERELRAQIERAQRAGIVPSHLDVHMFALGTRPDLIDLYVRLGLDYDIPVRFPKHEPLQDGEEGALDARERESLDAYYRNLKLLYSRGMPLLDAIEADNYLAQPNEKREYFLRVFQGLPPGVTEVVVHCAYDRPGLDLPPHASHRAVDARLFTSPEFAERLRASGVRLVTWREVRQLQDAGKLE
jgi:predicted glycoside hydrolase/deacetylase ChbG (UPF0249 family)